MTTEENHQDESNPFNTVATIIAETYFILNNLCACINGLIAAKAA
jgi:hypothetical protein